MTPKMTQKNYEAIKIYYQKEKIFELKGKIQTLEKQLKIAVEALKVYEKSFIGNGKNSVILENGTILEYNPKIAEKALNDIEGLEK